MNELNLKESRKPSYDRMMNSDHAAAFVYVRYNSEFYELA